MGCNCGKPKCDGHCGISPAVLQINNPSECVLFHKVEIPASMGNEITIPPDPGLYKNVLLYYEATGNAYFYSSDGIPTPISYTDYTRLTNKPSINGVMLVGNKTAEELGITSEPFYVYCIDAQPGDPDPGEGVYIYKDASCTVPMTVGEILDAYRNGDRVVFADASATPSPDEYTFYIYNELVRVSVTYANGTSHPATRVRFYIMNNRAGADVPSLLSQACWAATSLSDTWLSITRVNAQARLTAGDGITISGNVISATGGGGGGATMFYADLQNVYGNLGIYTDSSQSDIVDSAAMIAALSRGPVMIQDMNNNNIFVTVVSANGSSGPVSIVIDMYDAQGNPATRRFEFEGPDWVEPLLN